MKPPMLNFLFFCRKFSFNRLYSKSTEIFLEKSLKIIIMQSILAENIHYLKG